MGGEKVRACRITASSSEPMPGGTTNVMAVLFCFTQLPSPLTTPPVHLQTLRTASKSTPPCSASFVRNASAGQRAPRNAGRGRARQTTWGNTHITPVEPAGRVVVGGIASSVPDVGDRAIGAAIVLRSASTKAERNGDSENCNAVESNHVQLFPFNWCSSGHLSLSPSSPSCNKWIRTCRVRFTWLARRKWESRD